MRANEFLTELFKNQTVPWKWDFRGSDGVSALFTVGDVPYRFNCYTSNPKIWEVEFSVEDDEVRAANKDYGITGTGNAATVMSTVVGILKEFIAAYKDKIDVLQFSAEEDSRMGLYARMAHRLLPDWNYFETGGHFLLKSPEFVASQASQKPFFKKPSALWSRRDRERELARQSEVEESVGSSGYKEIEFVCVNSEFADASSSESQKRMYADLKKIPGVTPLWQDWSDDEQTQLSLTAIFKDPKVKQHVLAAAKRNGMKVDLVQPVSDDYVDRAIRGEHDGQVNEDAKGKVSFTTKKAKGGFVVLLMVDGQAIGTFHYYKDKATGDVRNAADIDPSQQGKGYGKLLLLKAILTASEMGIDFQEDSNSMSRAQSRVYDSLADTRYIIDDDGYWYITQDGVDYLNGGGQEVSEGETYQPPSLEVGDKILRGKFKNSPAEIKGFKKDKHNQPVLKTNKGDIQLFKPRVTKLSDK